MYVQEKEVDWASKERIASCAKLFFLFLSLAAIEQGRIVFGTLLLALFVACDMGDGPLARQRPFWTTTDDIKRRRFDNICDVAAPSAFCIYLFHQTGTSLWWFVPLLVREAMLSLLAVTALAHAKTVVFPNMVHKAAKMLLALAGIMVLNQWHGKFFLLLAYGALYVTLFDYWGLFRALIPREKSTAEDLRALYPENLAGLVHLFRPKNNLLPSTQRPILLP